MPEKVTERVATNLKDRFTSLTDIPKDEVDTIKSAWSEAKSRKFTPGVDKLKAIKPVQGVLDIGVGALKFIADAAVGTVDTVANFIQDQAEITRRWIKR